MQNLSTLIEEYAIDKERVDRKGKELKEKVKEAFLPEFEKIKGKLPSIYQVTGYSLLDPPTCVTIENPTKNGRVVNKAALFLLNALFKKEFNEIYQKYGFEVCFDYVSFIG